MGEALRNVVVLVWALSAVNSPVEAKPNVTVITEKVSSSQPTIVYGAAENKNGQKNEVIVEQPASGGNPLGNPIVIPEANGQEQKVSGSETTPSVNSEIKKSVSEINEVTSQNPKISPENTPQKMDNEIQNTLYESGNRIYDIQSYPVKDINDITEPNVDNEVVNYPIY